jgi:quercetin dioxygenase-like cupin family protein
MKVFPYDEVEAETAEGGAYKTKLRWLITKEIGAENFAMRLFEMEPGGYSPLHTHPWEHEVFIIDGKGDVFDGEKSRHFRSGDAVFVPSNEKHQFRNKGKGTLKFLCLIPYRKE